MEDEWAEATAAEIAFHGAVREYLICFLLFLSLYGASFAGIRVVRRRAENDELYGGDAEDALVYRISVWICTFSLATALGSVLLLPFSVLGNEVRRLYPDSYYIKWLNSSLIASLWRYVFLLSNLCIFIFLPFAYFFIESQGFSGLRRGIMTRVYEAVAVCALLVTVLCCMAHVVAIALDEESARLKSLFKIWNYQLPFIYSCVSLFGVSALLMCTPIGFGRMFSVVGNLIIRPQVQKELDQELRVARLEEITFRRKINYANGGGENGHGVLDLRSMELASGDSGALRRQKASAGVGRGGGGEEPALVTLQRLRDTRLELERRQRLSRRCCSNLKYPLAMLALLFLTALVGLMVVSNVVQLLVGFRSLPSYRQYVEIGSDSLSSLGIFGACIEITTILYMMAASLVGLYSVPGLRRMAPGVAATSMTALIGNSLAVLVLSSALPVLARTLGMSNFDLLGEMGRLDWLRNFTLVWGYNLAFLAATALALISTFTAPLRRELLNKLRQASQRIGGRRRHASSDTSGEPPPDLPPLTPDKDKSA